MKYCYTLCFFISSTFFLLGQKEQVRDFPMEKSALLWEITRNDMPSKSYLFGTMHLIEKDYFIFPKKLQKRIKNSELLLLELSEIPAPSELMEHIMLAQGTLFDLFTKEQTDSILQWANDSFNIQEDAFRAGFSKLKPFAVMQLAIQLQFTGKTESYESSFQKLANEHNVQIKGLETISEQMALFDNLSNKEQVEMLMELIRQGDEASKLINDMQELYTTQHIDSLFLFITEQSSVVSGTQNEFIDARNKKWIPKIVSYIMRSSTFIAVGAGHLGGTNGLIRLLEAEGYDLKPIKL